MKSGICTAIPSASCAKPNMRAGPRASRRTICISTLKNYRKATYLLQCFAAFVDLGDPAPGADPLVTALEEIDQFKRIMRHTRKKLLRCTRRRTSAGMLRRERSAGCSPSRKAPAARAAVGVLRRMV